MATMVNLFWIIAFGCFVVAFGGLVFGGMIPLLPKQVSAFMFAAGLGVGMLAILFCLGCFAAEVIQRH